MNWLPYRDPKADVSSVSPSSERIKFSFEHYGQESIPDIVFCACGNLTRILLLNITNSVVLLATLLMVYLNDRVFLSTNHLNTECFCRGTIG